MPRKPRKQWKPYLMHGEARPHVKRATSVDKPDPRVPEVRPRKLTPAELAARTLEGGVDPRLRPIDLCFEAWAATPGDGSFVPRLAQPNLMGSVGGSNDILDEQSAKLIDRTLREAPPWAVSFIKLWYRSALTVQEIAVELAIKNRQGVYIERTLVLGYFLGRFDPRDVRTVPRPLA